MTQQHMPQIALGTLKILNIIWARMRVFHSLPNKEVPQNAWKQRNILIQMNILIQIRSIYEDLKKSLITN